MRGLGQALHRHNQYQRGDRHVGSRVVTEQVATFRALLAGLWRAALELLSVPMVEEQSNVRLMGELRR